MDAFIKIFTNRRGWVALVPAIVAVSALFGVNVDPGDLTGLGDKVTEVIMGALALWSLYLPKASS